MSIIDMLRKQYPVIQTKIDPFYDSIKNIIEKIGAEGEEELKEEYEEKKDE
jgi:hypothetical protein